MTKGFPPAARLISESSISGVIMRSLSVVALVSALTSQAAAAECALSNATYTQDDTSFELQFSPRTRESGASTTSLFTLRAAAGQDVVDFSGEVIWGNGISVPGGFITKDCPADAMTVDELAPCTYWEGVMYAISGDVAAHLSDDETTPAPPGLLLPDLGRALYYGTGTFQFDEVAGDYFRLTGCTK